MRKIWDAESAAKIQRRQRALQPCGNMAGDFQPLPVLSDQNPGTQNLRSGEDVYAAKFELVPRKQPIERLINGLFIHAKRSGPAAHAHGAALGFAAGIHAQRDGSAHAEAPGNGCDARRPP